MSASRWMKISPISTTKNIRENILQDNSRRRIKGKINNLADI